MQADVSPLDQLADLVTQHPAESCRDPRDLLRPPRRDRLPAQELADQRGELVVGGGELCADRRDVAQQPHDISGTLAVAKQRELLPIGVEHVREARKSIPLATIVASVARRVDALAGCLDFDEADQSAADMGGVVGSDAILGEVMLTSEDDIGDPDACRHLRHELLERSAQEILWFAGPRGEASGDRLSKTADGDVESSHLSHGRLCPGCHCLWTPIQLSERRDDRARDPRS